MGPSLLAEAAKLNLPSAAPPAPGRVERRAGRHRRWRRTFDHLGAAAPRAVVPGRAESRRPGLRGGKVCGGSCGWSGQRFGEQAAHYHQHQCHQQRDYGHNSVL